jgi:hypothetical protein
LDSHKTGLFACPPTAADKGGCDDKDKHMVVFSLVPALWEQALPAFLVSRCYLACAMAAYRPWLTGSNQQKGLTVRRLLDYDALNWEN